ALLSLAAVAQAAVAAAAKYGTGGTGVAVNFTPLCLIALATTVPLLFLRPAAAVLTITVANALLLSGFETATGAGVIAQLMAAYRAGAAAEPRPVRGAGAQYLGVMLAVPFVIPALEGRGGAAAVLLACGGPAAAGAGIAARARREARRRTVAGE